MLVTGIDEAGYGPILGPLVVSAVTFEVPDPLAGTCLWTLLSRCVTQRPRPPRTDPRLPVCDSKQLHTGDRKLARLERTAQAFLGLAGDACPDFAQLFETLADQWGEWSARVPWYRDQNVPLPVAADEAQIRTQQAAVGSTMAGRGIRLVRIRSVVLPAAEYNRMVSATKSKAAVLFWATLRLVTRALAEDRSAHTVLIDRQGGRVLYGSILMKTLDIDRLHVMQEDRDASRYTLVHLPHLCEIGFFRNGEEHHLPIALASIISKYLRELCMQLFNRYWCGQIEGLVRTAGYYTDGLRFAREISPHLRRLRIDESCLVRLR